MSFAVEKHCFYDNLLASMNKKHRANVGPGKVVLSLYFDEELHKKLKERAEKERRSLSNYMRWLVEQAVKGDGDFNDPQAQLPGFAEAA